MKLLEVKKKANQKNRTILPKKSQLRNKKLRKSLRWLMLILKIKLFL